MNTIYQLHHDNRQRTKRPANVVKNGAEASLYIYDVISAYWGISSAAVIDALAQVSDATTLNVYINSPGGDVFEGRAIMAALGRFKGKTIAIIDSLAASAATSIALACNEVVMLEGALFMIHNASSGVWGDKTDMRSTADLLEKIELSIIKDYTNKTGKDDAEVIAMMDAESWFTAAEALANGFIDRIEPVKAASSNAWNLAAYKNAPKLPEPPPLPKTPETPETPPAPDLTALAAQQTQLNRNRLRLMVPI